MFSLIQKRMRGGKGFTLIELLVVIIIIAILAAIAIPTFLGQRQKAQDSSAKSLVRNTMTAVESAYTDERDFTAVGAADIEAIEPSIDVVDLADAATAPTADADANQVNYDAVTADAYEVGTVSLSDETFGCFVNKSSVVVDTDKNPGNTYYIGGVATDW